MLLYIGIIVLSLYSLYILVVFKKILKRFVNHKIPFSPKQHHTTIEILSGSTALAFPILMSLFYLFFCKFVNLQFVVSWELYSFTSWNFINSAGLGRDDLIMRSSICTDQIYACNNLGIFHFLGIFQF